MLFIIKLGNGLLRSWMYSTFPKLLSFVGSLSNHSLNGVILKPSIYSTCRKFKQS